LVFLPEPPEFRDAGCGRVRKSLRRLHLVKMHLQAGKVQGFPLIDGYPDGGIVKMGIFFCLGCLRQDAAWEKKLPAQG
jgi:hypothetical protein